MTIARKSVGNIGNDRLGEVFRKFHKRNARYVRLASFACHDRHIGGNSVEVIGNRLCDPGTAGRESQTDLQGRD